MRIDYSERMTKKLLMRSFGKVHGAKNTSVGVPQSPPMKYLKRSANQSET